MRERERGKRKKERENERKKRQCGAAREAGSPWPENGINIK